ncbi:unnamed protein product [Rotaria magnacalcarata]|uniref:Uncharacterized protein n=1 Tax=Rotaria magnacalcarata TaxID=392030 RepID=A0A814Z430_9BILA|nr:unnamed protein product [Rotaria magnacalcarata]CAF3788092.1 unnamed protein product [Rotaria magnacalcarata]
MSETQYNYYGNAANYINEGQRYATSFQGGVGATSTHLTNNQQQQWIASQSASSNSMTTSSAPKNQALGGVQTTDSFHSVSSIDSSAEMSKYFPDARTPSLSPFRHQQVVEGQAQSTATSNTVASTNTNRNTVNAGPYTPATASTAVQRLPQPIRPPNMSQQQPVQPPGIPSYSSQIEGLSVSQAVVNDVLIDLQTKVINETLKQYHDDSSSGTYMEPLAPIYIRAPQPTIILQSDLHRLRAELGNRVRPPVMHPAGGNQFQQNTFQVPRFPAPPQQHISPECYGDYRNVAYANSDEYKTTTATTTTGDEYRKANEERLYNQAESAMLNDDNINGNVHSAFNLQGLSNTSFDRHASASQSSSSLSNLEEQQQRNEDTSLTSTHNINSEQVSPMDNNMFSMPGRPRPEITFDIDNCIYRCFEAHRQRVARRRAARQARKSRRHRQVTQQPHQSQQLHYTNQYPNFTAQPIHSSAGTIEEAQWQQQPLSTTDYSNIINQPTNNFTPVRTTQGPYTPAGTYDYSNLVQATSLPTDTQSSATGYSGVINQPTNNFTSAHTTKGPYTPARTYDYSNLVQTTTLPTGTQSSATGYSGVINQPTNNFTSAHTTQGPYTPAGTYDYSNLVQATSLPTDTQSSATDYYQYTTTNIQEPYIHSNAYDYTPDQSVPQQQTSFEYSNQLPYSFSSTDATIPSDMQYLTSNYYQEHQQQLPTEFTRNQDVYAQPSTTFEYGTGTNVAQVSTSYDYQNINQSPNQYTYNAENIQQEPSLNYATTTPTTDNQGTFDYTTTNTEPQYPYDIENLNQQQRYDYATSAATGTLPFRTDFQERQPKETIDHLNQAGTSSSYYEQQSIPAPVYQGQASYGKPTGTFEYTRESSQSQEPIYEYQGSEQQSSQYSYNVEDIQQQPQQQETFNYVYEVPTSYITNNTDVQQKEQTEVVKQVAETSVSTTQHEKQPVSVPVSQVQETSGKQTGTFEYARESYQSKEPIYDHQSTELKTDQTQTINESSQEISSSTHDQEQATVARVAETSGAELRDQKVTGTSITSGKTEDTKEPSHPQEPLSDNYSTENFIEQQEKAETLSVNDYIKQFESKSQSPQNGGPIQSSDERQSTRSTKISPFIIQQNVYVQPSQESTQTYDLQNYTSENTTSETAEQSQAGSWLPTEEDKQRLLQDNTRSKPAYESFEKTEQQSEKEVYKYDTNSSLPPPPPLPTTTTTAATSKGIEHQQESTETSTYNFPPPPTLDPQAYQIKQQRTNRSIPTIIPTTDQASIYTNDEQLQPTSDDPDADESIAESEELFDLHKCIAKCYEKYREAWDREAKAHYAKQVATNTSQTDQQLIQQPNALLVADYDHQKLPQQYFGGREIHYVDTWTQTPSLNVITQPNFIGHTYDETPSTFDTKPYKSQTPPRHLSTDSRGQQTIEYSPPLITQTRQVISTIPQSEPFPFCKYTTNEQPQSEPFPVYKYTTNEQPQSEPFPSYKYTTNEQPQQQKQAVYDHTLPLSPHLSFNETLHQPNLDFSSQITDQPRQYEKTPFDAYKQQQQQQRYRAHSVPASIKQDSILTVPSQQPPPPPSQEIEHQPRRSVSIPMSHPEQSQTRLPSVRLIDNGRAYETDSALRRCMPRIDPKTGLCLVPCPQTKKYAHLPSHLRPELFCIELPSATSLPPPPPPPPPLPPQPVQQEQWCVKCCCAPGKSIIKKIVYRQVEEQQNHEESQFDYASVIDQMGTTINVRYGNDIMEDTGISVSGGYNEQLRVIDFPVYISGQDDSNLMPLIPAN